MLFFFSFVVFFLFAAVIFFGLLKLYIKPKEAIERVAGTGMSARCVAGPSQPAVSRSGEAFGHAGACLAQRRDGHAAPADSRRLPEPQCSESSVWRESHLRGAAAGLTRWVLGSSMSQSNKFAAILVALAAGFFGPNQYILHGRQTASEQVQRGLANALDLMVVCVESGLGLDQAVMQVAKELEHAHPEISEEPAIVNLELKAGKRRAEALRNLADRTAVEDLKKLVAVLIQADRFGTGVAQVCARMPTICGFKPGRWPRRRPPNWASSWCSRFSFVFCRLCLW